MGLLDLLRKLKKNDKDAKILVLGLDNAGKTTLLKLLSSENPTETTPTQGFNVKSIIKDSFKLNVWDIGGQKEIRKYWENYYDNVDGLIFVVDSSDDIRVSECNIELKLLISVTFIFIFQESKLAKVPILIFANKQDLAGALSPEEIMESMELSDIQDRAWVIHSCSAIKGDGVQEGLKWLMENISKKNI